MLIPSAGNEEITPAMLAVLWGIADELDNKRLPANLGDAVWLEIPAARLRNPDGRDDNFWLKKCLNRLTGLKLSGEYRGDPWGAVVLAQWEMRQGGSLIRLLIPPAAVQAITSPKTFARIEITAAYRLKGNARRLYAALADKKRMGKPFWTYELEELYAIFDSQGQYEKWFDFRRYVLEPALSEINDYGTVTVQMTPIKTGRSVTSVRFDWEWKSLDQARVTDEENAQPAGARHMDRQRSDAPPLTGDDTKRDSRAAQIAQDKAAFRDWKKENPRGSFQQYLREKP